MHEPPTLFFDVGGVLLTLAALFLTWARAGLRSAEAAG